MFKVVGTNYSYMPLSNLTEDLVVRDGLLGTRSTKAGYEECKGSKTGHKGSKTGHKGVQSRNAKSDRQGTNDAKGMEVGDTQDLNSKNIFGSRSKLTRPRSKFGKITSRSGSNLRKIRSKSKILCPSHSLCSSHLLQTWDNRAFSKLDLCNYCNYM